MDGATLLDPGSVRCEPEAGSKKRALEILSGILASAAGGIKPGTVLDGLAARERLGSTGLGSAVAMPHTRLAGVGRMVGAFLRLATPVDFDAIDGQPVDMLFGLLVPERSRPDDLKDVRELVKKLRTPELQRALRAAEDPASLYESLLDGLRLAPPTVAQRNSGR
jgi:PTS system nitrogen regulatory IIA component